MTDFKNKASEIKAAGVAERGNFTPSGVPLRIYNYWLDNSASTKAFDIKHGNRRENFCHFWRVVAIWAGLLWLGRGVVKAFSNKTFNIVLGVVIIAALATVLTVTHTWLAALVGVGIATGFVAVVAGVGISIAIVQEKFWNPRWNDMASKIFFGVMIAIAAGSVIAMLVFATIDAGWIVPIIVASIIALAALLIFGGSKWSEYLAGKRALERKKHQEMLHNMTDEEYYAWRAEQSKAPEPSKFALFFIGVGDFLILIFQVVRVKKWKICPLVEVGDN